MILVDANPRTPRTVSVRMLKRKPWDEQLSGSSCWTVRNYPHQH